ncbi:MAG: tRNA (pseudouridine54-N1)-methyltransferase [Thermoplasmata archaeon]|jgi:tRNA (pseudouridine54-N1)-methyltransferase|nr:tRNA (pseudouridine54-N1)-methyltransferase [Thermoplasmata archaeon]
MPPARRAARVRRFLVIGHKAASAPGFSHKDLSGTGGRLDILARCVGAALLVSHGLRPDVELVTLHLGPPTPPKAVRFDGARLQHANPDERSSALLLEKALGAPTTGPVWAASTPGISVAVMDLAELLDALRDPIVILDEAGEDVATARIPARATFVLGDHLGFTPEEAALLKARAVASVSLGPVSLQADQCITVLHNHLDRRN